jgi:thermostable 8-oxoguanine DNA glycosylase
MSSRKGVQHAALDTHILRWMRDKGVNAPKSTPTGKKYLTLEQQYLTMVPAEKTPAEFDLEIWKKYSSMLLTKPISMV